MSASSIYLIIPAYNPGPVVVEVVQAALPRVDYLVLVDDGCDDSDKTLLQQLAALPKVTLLTHDRNQGKGVALYTGLTWCLAHMQPTDYILCMDSDGQHDARDIDGFRKLLENCPAVQFALGERLDSSGMPWKSRFGNRISRALFRLQFGGKVHDTQTGYRLLSREFARLCVERINPGRYETEMKILILAARVLDRIHSVKIRTIYFNGNDNSKFNPLKDSWRVLRLFFNYGAVSLASFVFEYLLYVVFLTWLGVPYLAANVAARVLSAVFNFVAHKEYSFSSKGAFFRKALKYAGAVLHALVLGSLLLYLGVGLVGIPELLAKPLVDIVVFIINFFVLSRLVFAETRMQTGD